MGRPRIEDEADFVVVGTGAGGATAARVLAASGASVVMLEEGPRLRPEDRPRELLEAMRLGVRDMCMQATEGRVPMPLLQGRAVGGSTAINSGIVWRLPADVRRDWVERFGLGAWVDRLDDVFATLEDELSVAPTDPAVRGGNNALMARAADALGLPGRVIRRNVDGCRGAARCLQGCPHGARQSMDVSYVPRALADGARLHTGCRAERANLRRGRAVGVEGVVVDDERRSLGRFSVRARRGVILSAGVLHTPILLMKSGVRHRALGRRFQCHPGVAMVGRFDEPVRMGFGASQGYEVPLRDRGYKLEALALPPEMLAARIPGAGAAWQERIADLGRYAQWCGQVRMRAHGRVTRRFGRPAVRYEPLGEDLAKAQEVVVLLGRMMFAAGATEIYPGVAGFDEIVTDPKRLDVLEQATLRRADLHLVASHLFGTAGASADPAGVVDETLRVRGVEGLHVMDASALPTNLGVNPQHTIMAVVWQAAARLAEARRAAA
ncbi:MAG TPA: GMC family oxidoreductase [Sandaracinaceae bacterium LLY-WYZ-13_1]|nr:GMC family oxidoreductase [Sandaracinaceae bacterium LLY-WYZ-13_1]